MIVPENFLNKFIRNTLMEEVHLPHGTKSAKVITHVDLDGVVSAISLVQQLQKQGIPKERITIEFAQYGDSDKKGREFTKMFKGKKSQWVGVTDFAKLPKGKPWEVFNKIMDFKGKPDELINLLTKYDFSKTTEEHFKDRFKKMFNFKESKWTDNNLNDMYDCCVAYSILKKEKAKKSQFIKDYDNDFQPITQANYKTYQIKLVNPDFVSDHHSNEANDRGNKALSKGQTGEIATGSDSEAEFFANKYAPGLWSQEDLKAVSVCDAAKYTEDELKNTVFLQKQFLGPNKKRNLASLVSLLYDALCKKDDKVCKWIILNSGTNLVSLYTTIKKAIHLNGERLRMLEAVKNGDFKTGQEIANALPKILNKNWTDKDSKTYKNREGREIKSTMTLDRYRNKDLEDLEDAKTGYASQSDKDKLAKAKEELANAKADAKARKVVQKNDPKVISADKVYKDLKSMIESKKGKLSQYWNFTIFDGSDKKKQYGRYLASLYSVKGTRTPFTLRWWGGDSFFQVSVNPIYKAAAKKLGKNEVVDFANVNRHVISDVCKHLREKGISDFNVKRIEDEMYEKNGGHKGGIWSFNGFDLIKAPSKEAGSYWDDREKVNRANDIIQKKTGKKAWNNNDKLNNAKQLIPNIANRYENTENTVMNKYSEIKHETYRYAMSRAIYWTNMLYPVIPGTEKALANNDERFEANV